jgi:hypothetical protein
MGIGAGEAGVDEHDVTPVPRRIGSVRSGRPMQHAHRSSRESPGDSEDNTPVVPKRNGDGKGWTDAS